MRGGTIPIMDDYSRGNRDEKKKKIDDDFSFLTDPAGAFEAGGNARNPGGPKHYSQNPDNNEDDDTVYLKGLPGEAVLMDDEENDMGEAGDSHDGLGDRFTSRGEGIEDDDTMPIGGESERLDKGPPSPQSMHRNRGNVFRRIKQDTKIKGLRL